MRLRCPTTRGIGVGAYGVTLGLDTRSLSAGQRCRTAGGCCLCPTPRGLPRRRIRAATAVGRGDGYAGVAGSPAAGGGREREHLERNRGRDRGQRGERPSGFPGRRQVAAGCGRSAPVEPLTHTVPRLLSGRRATGGESGAVAVGHRQRARTAARRIKVAVVLALRRSVAGSARSGKGPAPGMPCGSVPERLWSRFRRHGQLFSDRLGHRQLCF